MSYLLRLSVSPQGDNSRSRAVGNEFVEAYKATHPDVEIRVRDLNSDPVPHLDGEAIMAGYVPEDSRSESQASKHNFRLTLCNEIIGASAILVDTPMWNWNTPSVLKAYIDQIILPGTLDPYTKQLLAEKPVTIVIACGGAYGPGSWHPEWDHETEYLKLVFSRLGATNIEAIRSEYCLAGIVPGMEDLVDKKEESFAAAKEAAKSRATSI